MRLLAVNNDEVIRISALFIIPIYGCEKHSLHGANNFMIFSSLLKIHVTVSNPSFSIPPNIHIN